MEEEEEISEEQKVEDQQKLQEIAEKNKGKNLLDLLKKPT